MDGIGVRWARAGLWLPLAGTLLLVAVYVIQRPLAYWLLREDHPVEWLQFAFCVFAAVTSALAAGRTFRRGRWGLALLLVVVALGCVVLAGEEISWGQRVFNLAEPSDLAAINNQGELNLHNLKEDGISADVISEVMEFLMGLGVCVMTLFTRPPGALWRNAAWWWVTPPLFTLPSFLLLSLYRGSLFVVNSNASPVVIYQEWVEACFYLMIAVTVATSYTRAADGRYAVVVTDGSAERQLDRTMRPGVLPLAVVGVLAAVLTVVFAIMTVRTGLLPGNVPKP